MGKRKGNKQAAGALGGDEARRRAAFLAGALAASTALPAALGPPRPTFAELLADNRGEGTTAERCWGIESSKGCCRKRDGVLVAAPNANLLAEVRRDMPPEGDRDFVPIGIGVFNAHRGGAFARVQIDVEDAKRLVNALGEAIALAEAQGAAVDG